MEEPFAVSTSGPQLQPTALSHWILCCRDGPANSSNAHIPDTEVPLLLCLQADGLAGLSVAAMAVPQCVCFAGMAGLPASYGLYGVIVPSFCYALCGSSPHLVGTIIIIIISIIAACICLDCLHPGCQSEVVQSLKMMQI